MCLYQICLEFYHRHCLERCTTETAQKLSFDGQSKICKVLSVYDGDTCTLAFYDNDGLFNNQVYQWKCRLYGINAPEIRCKDLNEKNKGFISRDHLKSRIEGKLVTAELKKFEKYGRILAVIYLEDGTNINQEMVDKNLAVRYLISDNEEIE